MFLTLALGLTAGLVDIEARSQPGLDEGEQTRRHWELAYKAGYTEHRRCRRDRTQLDIAFHVDSRDKATVFYRIDSLTLAGTALPESLVKQANDVLYSFDTMPYVSLQCARGEHRLYFNGKRNDENVSEHIGLPRISR